MDLGGGGGGFINAAYVRSNTKHVRIRLDFGQPADFQLFSYKTKDLLDFRKVLFCIVLFQDKNNPGNY